MKFYQRCLSAGDGGGTAGESVEEGLEAKIETKSDESGSKSSGEEGKTAEPEKKYTEADFEKFKSEYEHKISQASEEAAKKAAMKPDEKEEYEKAQRLKNIEEKEKELAAKQLKLDTLDVLEKNKVDKDFLDFVIGSDLKETEMRAEKFKQLFDQKVNEQVVASYAGKTPPANSGGNKGSAIASDFRKGLGV